MSDAQPPFERTTVTAPDGATLAVFVTGRGEPLLLIAGQALDHRAWDPVLPAFARRFQVITYDHRGTGESTGALPVGWSTRDFARDAAAVLDGLRVPRARPPRRGSFRQDDIRLHCRSAEMTPRGAGAIAEIPVPPMPGSGTGEHRTIPPRRCRSGEFSGCTFPPLSARSGPSIRRSPPTRCAPSPKPNPWTVPPRGTRRPGQRAPSRPDTRQGHRPRPRRDRTGWHRPAKG